MSQAADARRLPLEAIGQRFSTLRLCRPAAVARMEASLRRHGQIAPVVVCPAAEDGFELVDGFKRLAAARAIDGFRGLSAHVLETEARVAKAALLQLNWVARPVSDFEEALVVRSLCRDDGLTQAEVSLLVGRDRSWVSRRLSLVERLSETLQDDLRLGLLRPTEARELSRVPRGTQPKVLQSCREHRLSSRDVARLCQLVLQTDPHAQQALLENPIATLHNTGTQLLRDERLSALGQSTQRALTELSAQCQRVVQRCAPERLGALTAAEWLILAPPLHKARGDIARVRRVLEQHGR